MQNITISQKNYDSEIEAFERHLEKVYRLCLSCQTRVQQELQLQNEAIGKRLQNLNVSSESFSTTKMNKSFDMVCFHSVNILLLFIPISIINSHTVYPLEFGMLKSTAVGASTLSRDRWKNRFNAYPTRKKSLTHKHTLLFGSPVQKYRDLLLSL